MKIISNGKKHIRIENEKIVLTASYYNKIGDNYGSGWEITKLIKDIPFWNREYCLTVKTRNEVKKHLLENEGINLTGNNISNSNLLNSVGTSSGGE